jgi:hypothetical protein
VSTLVAFFSFVNAITDASFCGDARCVPNSVPGCATIGSVALVAGAGMLFTVRAITILAGVHAGESDGGTDHNGEEPA